MRSNQIKNAIAAFCFAAVLFYGLQSNAFMLRRSSGNIPTVGISTLKIGGGGFTTGMQICNSDGTMVSRTNTSGAYVATISAGLWSNTLTTASLPSAVYSSNGGSSGVSEIQAACSSTQTLYMAFNGYRLKSTDRGANWTQLTNYSQNTNENANSGPGGSNGSYGPLISIDEADPARMITGATGVGAFYTINGGTAFTAISTGTIAAPTVSNGPVLVQYQAGSSTVIFVCSWGNQCYRGTGGPAGSWTQTSGGPATYFSLRVDSSGVAWVSDASANLWRWNGSWTQVLTATGSASYGLSVSNPSDNTKVWAITYNGDVNYSTDTGATWSGVNTSTGHTVTATDIPWLASNKTNQTAMSSAGYATFDTGAGKVYVATGTGVFKATLPTASVSSATVTWDSVTAAQESIVGTSVIAPNSGQYNLCGWDRPAWRSTNPQAYPATQAYSVTPTSIMGCWSIAAAQSPNQNTLLMLATNNGGGAGTGLFMDMSGYSTDGGQTWTPFGPQVTSSVTSGTGSKTICGGGCAAMQGLNITNGDTIQVYQQSNYANWLNGVVTAYNSGTGSLTMTVGNTVLTGTISDLIVSVKPPNVITGKFGGCIALAPDGAHALWLGSKDTDHPYYSTNWAANVWNSITVSGVPTSGTTGWGAPANSGGFNGCQVTADLVTANKFILVNSSSQPGVYTCDGAAGTCVRTKTSLPAATAGGAVTRIKSVVVGGVNHLYYSGGIGNSDFMKSTDGGANWTSVVNGAAHFNNVQAFCFGPSGYIYLIGDPDTSVNNLGVYSTQDGGTTWSLLTQWMNNNPDLPTDCAGDPTMTGYFAVGFGGLGSGFAYRGQIN